MSKALELLATFEDEDGAEKLIRNLEKRRGDKYSPEERDALKAKFKSNIKTSEEGLDNDPKQDDPKDPKDEGNVDERWHPKDDLLAGITFEELIDTVYSNERVRDEKAVMKVYRELWSANKRDADAELRDNMKNILKALKEAGD